MMKKTLVALALAATTVSGSAMAWTANGTGGILELSGTLTPKAKEAPWEVLVGGGASHLDAPIEIGSREAEVPVRKSITVLGIRTVSKTAFQGKVGIDPMIDFNGAIDTSKFDDGLTPLTLDIKDAANAKIGVMTVPLYAAAIFGMNAGSASSAGNFSVIGSRAFKGGLPATESGTLSTYSHASAVLSTLNPDLVANYDEQRLEKKGVSEAHFSSGSAVEYKFSGAYGAGIPNVYDIKLTLDTPATSNAIVWKASLPITVSYQ